MFRITFTLKIASIAFLAYTHSISFSHSLSLPSIPSSRWKDLLLLLVVDAKFWIINPRMQTQASKRLFFLSFFFYFGQVVASNVQHERISMCERASVRASERVYIFLFRVDLKGLLSSTKSERKKNNYVKNSNFTHLQEKLFNVFQSHAHTSKHTRKEYIHNSIQIIFFLLFFSDKLFSFRFRIIFDLVCKFFAEYFIYWSLCRVSYSLPFKYSSIYFGFSNNLTS